MSYTAVYEYLATVFTDTFTEMCKLHCSVPSLSNLPKRLEHMATDNKAFMNFLIVIRVMLLKVLLLPVILGKNYYRLQQNDFVIHLIITIGIFHRTEKGQ